MRGIPDLDIEALWTYHPPTPVTEPLYKAVRSTTDDLLETEYYSFSQVGDETQRLARVIQLKCPNCSDTNAAVEKCVMARMALNESIVLASRDPNPNRASFVRDLATQYLLEARWLACRAIAFHGGEEVL